MYIDAAYNFPGAVRSKGSYLPISATGIKDDFTTDIEISSGTVKVKTMV